MTRKKDPAYMTWPKLREMLWDRIKKNNDVSERGDGTDLVFTDGEVGALLAWAQQFDRAAQPRRDEEEETYQLIKGFSERAKPCNGEAVFTIRVGGEKTHINTQAKGIGQERALSLAIAALQAELTDAVTCPARERN